MHPVSHTASISSQHNFSLIFHLDNTTLHRIVYLIDPSQEFAGSAIETLNVLHLLEALILADRITLGSFEYLRSQEVSTRILEYINAASSTLTIQTIQSDWDNQLEIAIETANLMYEQRLLTFDPTLDAKLAQNIDVAAGRPRGVVEPQAAFWAGVFASKLSTNQIVDLSVSEVQKFRTDGLFIYGVANHADFRDRVLQSYSIFGPWPEDLWNRLHVLFRSFFNQRLASRVGSIYYPPPIRAEALKRAHSYVLHTIRESVASSRAPYVTQQRLDLVDYFALGISVPIPLLGFAAIPQGAKSSERFFDHLLKIRSDTVELRNAITQLNRQYAEGSRLENYAAAEDECRQLKTDLSRLFGLRNTEQYPRIVDDIGFLLKYVGTSYNSFERGIRRNRQKVTRFFANTQARMAGDPRIEEVIRYLCEK